MSSSTVITDIRGQTIALPKDMRFPAYVKSVSVRAQGLERIFTPVSSAWDSFFLGSPVVPADFLSVRAGQDSPTRESL